MNRKLSRGFSLAASLALVLSLVPSASASTTPAVEYVVGEPAVAVAPDAAFSSGKTYTGSHVSFSIGNADAGDTLSMASDEQASIEADKISVVGSKVYIGTGTEAVQIGSVNDTQNGQTGKSLVIDFASPLANGSFEESTAGTDQVPGWTVNKNAVLLGDLAVKTQGRPVISSGSLAPFTVTGQDYSFQSDKAYRTGSQAYEAMEGSLNSTYTTFNSAIEKNGTSNVLRLWFSGRLDSVNPVNGTGQMVYQSAFGPEAWSDSFTAKQGDQISLDWRAANGGDDYEVYGFLYNVETEKYTEILYGRGRTQNWKTSSGEVPEDGTYKFRFVAGSYDATGGKALGASLYLDNIRVISGQHEATDAIIQQVIQKVTFENNRAGAGGTRTLTINAVASDQTASSSTVALNVYDLYKVLYDGNGATSGTAPSDAGKYQTAQKASVLANSDLTKNGHAFTGWNTVADGSGTAYKEDDEMLISSKHVTLYAQWKRNEYNVYFDAAGGTSVEYQTVLYEDQAVKPQNPEKTGYTFSGWFEDSTLTDEWNFVSDSVMDETTLYAKWTANPQTIQFDTDGGSAVSDLTVDYDAKITQPDAPTKASHTFKGWQFEGSAWDFDKGVVKGDMTLTAKWEINEYILSFNSNEGSAVENQNVIYNEKGAKPAVPEKTGYTFSGWFTEQSFENKWDFEEMAVVKDTTLYAKWEAIPYEVTFESNGGSSVESATVLYDQLITAPAAPERTGYTFAGWHKGEAAWNFDQDLMTGDVTLHAKWTANPQTIQFDTDGGSAVSDLTVDYDAKITQPADPTKKGHTFKGWQFEGSAWDFDKGVVKGDMTLTAKWEINEYTLSFNSNEGSAVENQNVIYNEKGAKPAVPEKTGYTFSGWFTEQSFENKWNFEEMAVVNDTTLYAKWEAIPYEVTFESNGGSSVESATVLYDQLITAPAAPERTGYTFAGWHKGEAAWNFDQDLMIGDVTLHAKWTANPQTIQFDTDGGSAVSDLTVDYDAKITQPADPTKAGHTFKGWQFEGSVWDFEGNVVKGHMTLMADWQINSYSLEFEPNGGSEEAAQTVVYNTHAAKPTDPVKTGYTFGGWFTDEEWENEWSFEENVMTEDTVLKAKWTINSYVVTFHANRGSDVEPATVVYQEKAEKPSNPTRPGYSFVGWYTDEQLRSAYDFEAPVTADTSLYARWSSNAVPLPPSEDIVVDIISDSKPLVQTPVKRTTNPDGKITDSVTFTAEKASEFVRKQGERAGIARIVIPDSEDKVAETTVNVPSAALDTLKTAGSSLEMDTVNARILVPSASIAAFDQNLYFRVVPVKEEAAQQEIEERARQDEATGGAVVSVLGRPMTIETNMQNRPVTLTLPLPVEATEEELENLSVFIEHSNGTKEVVSGTVVEWKNGQKAIQFSVNHFSTFTILSMEAAMQEGTHEAYIHGFKDGTFRPDETVTRAQIAAMIVRNLEMTYNGKISYTDTKQSFAVKEIEMAREAGIILGFSDGTFRPDQAVTRGQVAAITSRFVQNMCGSSSDSALCETGTSLSFPDVEKDYWAAKAIQHAASVGIISGFGNGTFRPEQPITRAQAVVMLNRLFERGPLNGVEKPSFKDVPTSHWAFGQVEEGATTHSYTIDEQGNEWVQ